MTRSIRVFIFSISFYFVAIQAFCQETINQNKGKGSLNIAYWGELITHPGLTTELELPLFNANKHHLHWGITVGT